MTGAVWAILAFLALGLAYIVAIIWKHYEGGITMTDEDPICCNCCGKDITGNYTELFGDFYCSDCIEKLLMKGAKTV